MRTGRRVGRDGLLLAALLCVPLLVLLGFRVAAAPSDPPPVQERPLQLTTGTGPSGSASPTSPRTSSTSSPSSTSPPTPPRTSSPTPSSTSSRPTWTPPPSVTTRTQAPVPTYDDDADDVGDDGDDDEHDDD